MKNRFLLPLLGATLVAGLMTGCGTSQSQPSQNNQSTGQNQTGTTGQQTPAHPKQPKQYPKAPAMTIDKNKTYTAVLKTNKGDITINLFAKQDPITVNNFVFLSKDHYYDNVPFHRIIKTFMIQTGDPTGTGMGSPGYTFKDELPPTKPYAPGIVAMANAGPNTNGSQFFICSGPDAAQLNNMPNYTVFGEVSKGMDVVNAIASTPVTQSDSGEMSKPTQDVHINSVEITEQ